MFILKKKHEAVVKLLREQVETHVMLGRGREKNIQRLITERDSARAEAEANKADADKFRASRANLKQFRKADAKPILPDGLREQDGVIGFDCVSCDKFTEWHGDDVASFVDGARENRCGGSPRCIP